ncbi:CDGSH iron-sulfur domain-containing protein [Mycolicibacter terrae]|uniref:Iron-binding protein n=2 Tax=Mycolicibacter TaxID=1073531 RepID=A0A1A2NTG7_MYCSD|nr:MULTISPECIES: CDGSH iron-sulfur domain-containing protein [Mycolicibacter]OBH18368.1 iron-binding protein [Mycolicibacter sinensis]OBI29408.1 iron-binding protein [Mycolicibacter sinensis]RRR48570.1 CDGSH iron-sulfur domain-containing protein [Mycolicibacter terrae]
MTEPRVVRPVRNGPVLVPGPVRIETPEGVVESDRFMVAICACGRSRNYPLCDTSHRRREPSRRHVEGEVAEPG